MSAEVNLPVESLDNSGQTEISLVAVESLNPPGSAESSPDPVEVLAELGIWSPESSRTLVRLFPFLEPDEFVQLYRYALSREHDDIGKLIDELGHILSGTRSDLTFQSRVAEWKKRLRLLIRGVDLPLIAEQRGVKPESVEKSLVAMVPALEAQQKDVIAAVERLVPTKNLTSGIASPLPTTDEKLTRQPLNNSTTKVAKATVERVVQLPRAAKWNQDTSQEEAKQFRALIDGLANLPGMPDAADETWEKFLRTTPVAGDTDMTTEAEQAIAAILRDLVVRYFGSPADEKHGSHKRLSLGPAEEAIARHMLGFPRKFSTETSLADPLSARELLDWFRKKDSKFDTHSFQRIERSIMTALREILSATKPLAH